ncbi:MAG TPA: outer membrane protein transport protein [Kofleriaceae bacterium]|jgi:long-subunit fatty acid transport protein|nr:outer membrane protein transport protein [Kofleriaceae bacterium]
MTVCRQFWFAGLIAIAALDAPRLAAAGGLLLPGAGAVSTSRAGAAVASADDGEALVLNPAGIAKAEGTTITLSAAIFDYVMEFQRRGNYDAVPGESYPYAGQPFAAVKNDASPPLGIGALQPVPLFAVMSDLGGRVGGLHLGAGVYAPNAYPFRDLCTELGTAGCHKFQPTDNQPMDDPNIPPPPTRYDVMKQEAAVFLPSLAAAYRILPGLDLGARVSWGIASLKSTTALWGSPTANYEEDVKKDGIFNVDVSDHFVFGYGLGATYRPTPNLEFAANYSSELDIYGKGTATSQLGPSAGLPGLPTTIGPRSDDAATCAPGGTAAALKACVDLALPRNAQLAGRYKFLDGAGRVKGDVELDLDWENWGKSCSADDFKNGKCVSPGDYRVVVDAAVVLNGVPTIPLNDATIAHGFQDTYGIRAGGSYHLPVGAARADGSHDDLILRGGLGYETAAARTGWLRTDLDGAARTTITVGAAYRLERYEFSLGGGAILEGSPSNPNVGGGATPCNPTMADMTCNGSTVHQGPDPINPILPTDQQALSPVSQGDYKSHYLLFMLGVTAWF